MAKLPSKILNYSPKVEMGRPTNMGWKIRPISTSSKAGQSLKKLGMSDAGIRQLSSGQPILNKKDQEIVAYIVVEAMS